LSGTYDLRRQHAATGTEHCAPLDPRFISDADLSTDDRIILDDDSMPNLEARTTRLVPATLYSRMLARTA